MNIFLTMQMRISLLHLTIMTRFDTDDVLFSCTSIARQARVHSIGVLQFDNVASVDLAVEANGLFIYFDECQETAFGLNEKME
jgi:hypothetical protein